MGTNCGRPAPRGQKSFFDAEKSKDLKDFFADEEVVYSWKIEGEDSTAPDGAIDNRIPRGENCGCGDGTPCDENCGTDCTCDTKVEVKKVDPDFYKKMKKESTKRLVQKIESGQYSDAEKKIILIALQLRAQRK